jgi:hypothetical protein
MIMNSAAYGCGRTGCALAVGEMCLDFMLARMSGCYVGDREVYGCHRSGCEVQS